MSNNVGRRSFVNGDGIVYRTPTFAVARGPRHRQRCVVVEDRSRHPTEESQGADMAVGERFGRFLQMGLNEPDVRMRQDQARKATVSRLPRTSTTASLKST